MGGLDITSGSLFFSVVGFVAGKENVSGVAFGATKKLLNKGDNNG